MRRNLSQVNNHHPQFPFVFNNVAIGDKEGVLPISYDPIGESRNATLVPTAQHGVTVNVPVKRLDDYIRNNISSPEHIRLIKIDVEGFEFPVLKGLERFFVESSYRPLIVCEIKPWEVETHRLKGGGSYNGLKVLSRLKPAI